MIVSERIIWAFVREHYGDAFRVKKDEILVPSEYCTLFGKMADRKYKCGINIEKQVVHDWYLDTGWSFPEFVKIVKKFESWDEVDDYLFELASNELRSLTLKEAVQYVLKPKAVSAPTPVVTKFSGLPDEAKPINYNSTKITEQRFINYLKNRGISAEQSNRYKLHFASEGVYAGRIIIPFFEKGEVVWFQGRAITKDAYLRYLNPAGVSKSMLVYNIDRLNEGEDAVLMEGPFDAQVVDGQALMGPSASEMQVAKILQKKPKRIIVVPDIDKEHAAGLRGAVNTITRFKEQGATNLWMAFNVYGKDFSEIGYEKSRLTVDSAIPWNEALELKVRRWITKKEEKMKVQFEI